MRRSRSLIRRPATVMVVLAAVTVLAAACGSGGAGGGASGLATRSASRSPVERPSAGASLAPPPATVTTPAGAPTTVPASPTLEPTTPRPTLPTRNPSSSASEGPSGATVAPTSPPTATPVQPTSPAVSSEPATPSTSAAAAPPVPIPSASSTPAADNSSDTPWGWLVAGLAILAALIIGAALGVHRHRARQRWLAWRRDAEPALGAAVLARDLLPEGVYDITDIGHWQSVRNQVEQAARGLDSVATTGPSAEATTAARESAHALRNVVFALEAERLLTTSGRPPTAEQLAAAAAATAARRLELDAGISQLTPIVAPAPASSSPPQPPPS
jgi:hypothetical protein